MEKTYMPLINFGAILNFAEEIETQDLKFYTSAANNPACAEYKALFEQLAGNGKRNIQFVLRTRRENVTEMILEPIKDFTRVPFWMEPTSADNMSAAEALEIARKLEDRAQGYYLEAAEKIKALPEVSRALKSIAKKRASHRKKLDTA
jgi:rubrerythrin